MKRLSVWVAAISFWRDGRLGTLVGSAAARACRQKRVIAPPGPKPVGPTVPESWPAISSTSPAKARATATAGCPNRRRAGRADARERQDDRRGRRADAGARGLQPGLSRQHVELRDDGSGLARILSETAAGTSRPRCSPDADGHPGRDQCRSPSAISLRRKSIVPAGYPANSPGLPGVMAGDRLYLSGSFRRRRRHGQCARGSGRAGATRAGQHETDLDAAGMDFRHVVFVNPYLTDKASGQMNAIYAKHFEFGNTPARATIRVASLPGGNTIEFTGVAVRRSLEAPRGPPEEHAAERHREPVCLCRRHVLLFGQGPVHPRTRQGAGHLCRDRRGAGTTVDAEPPRWPERRG